MASYPTFDPSVVDGGPHRQGVEELSDPPANQPLFNRAFQGVYATGSTFKVVDAIAALEEGVITAGTRFYCNGSYPPTGTSAGRHWSCWTPYGHGCPDLATALAAVVRRLLLQRRQRLLQPGRDGARRLGRAAGPRQADRPRPARRGRGSRPDAGVAPQYFKNEIDKIWKPGNSIQLAIGQGDLQATPLQMAVLYSAIANGGNIVQPHLGSRSSHPQGKLVQKLDAPSRRSSTSHNETLDAVRYGLRQAATIGHLHRGVRRVPGRRRGQDRHRRGLTARRDYAWYASYAPSDDPRYVVVVMIEQGGHGGTAAAPAARMIYDALFHIDSGQMTGATSRRTEPWSPLATCATSTTCSCWSRSR